MTEHVLALEGYTMCPCGEWVVDAVARRTHGRCVPCYQQFIQPQLTHLELVGRGMRVQVPRTPASKRRKRKRRETEQRTSRRALARRAREVARQRVAAMVPDLYDALLAEERAKRGLDPYPIEIAIRGGAPDSDMAVVAALQEARR